MPADDAGCVKELDITKVEVDLYLTVNVSVQGKGATY